MKRSLLASLLVSMVFTANAQSVPQSTSSSTPALTPAPPSTPTPPVTPPVTPAPSPTPTVPVVPTTPVKPDGVSTFTLTGFGVSRRDDASFVAHNTVGKEIVFNSALQPQSFVKAYGTYSNVLYENLKDLVLTAGLAVMDYNAVAAKHKEISITDTYARGVNDLLTTQLTNTVNTSNSYLNTYKNNLIKDATSKGVGLTDADFRDSKWVDSYTFSSDEVGVYHD